MATRGNKKTDKREVAIRVENLSKTFRIPHEKHTSLKSAALNIFQKRSFTEFRALDGVEFEIKKGEFFGIIGRNGSGKSTLLKILAGIYVVDKGRVKINGKISPFLELGVGFNPELTGSENIFLGGSILGLSRKEIEEKYDGIVEFSELEEFIDMKMKNYSSGMQVRLAFSLAINVNAEILLMDEVLAVGDSNFQQKCLEEFDKYRAMGKTVILVTHDIGTIQKYCDRAMLLRDGNIKLIGSPEKIASQYVSLNMSDEEKRTAKEEGRAIKKRKDKTIKDKNRWGNMDIVTTKVEVLSSQKKSKRIFNPFDDMVIRIHYKKRKKEIQNVVFGIEILNSNGYRLFGFNTSMTKKAIVVKKDIGYVDFILQNIPFLNGRYTITPAIASKNCNIQYDYWENAAEFKIMNNEFGKFSFGDISIKLRVE